MGVKIVMTICMLPLLLIMYAVLKFMGGEQRGTQYGVTMWTGANDSSQVQEIKKNYKKELNRITLFCFLLFLATLFPRYESLMITGQLLWVYLVIVLMSLPFARANGKMKAQKREYWNTLPQEEREAGKNVVLVDVTAAGTPKTKMFWKSVWGGIIFTALPVLAELYLNHVRPNPHDLNLWFCEAVLGSIAAAALLFPWYLHILAKQKTEVLTYNSQINIQIARVRRYHWGKFCVAMTWLTGALNWGILVSFRIRGQGFFWMLMAVSMIYAAAGVILCFYCWRQSEKAARKYLGQEPMVCEDKDECWLWGIFYYNKADSRSRVDSRAGIGYTYNMAKPGIKYGMTVLIALCILGTIVPCGWMILEEFTPISLVYEDDVLIADHWKEAYRIKEEEIERAVLLEEMPEITRRRGTGMERVMKGTFYSDRERRDYRVCLNPKEPPFLMIETKDGSWYLLGGNDGKETEEIYRDLHERTT